MEPLVLHAELEDRCLGESDADNAFEGDEFPDDIMRFQVGRHTSGEPDDAHDANRRRNGFDDAESGCG